MTEQCPIIGCATDAQPRLEIRELQTKTEQWTLFIFAMADIQLPEHRPKPLRFGDLGGIHGLPYERWAGDPASADQQPEGSWGGYCNHGSVLFPVWHRPYVLAIEQSISLTATRLARRWTNGLDNVTVMTWKTAAETLRFPFWDWTDKHMETEGLPDVLQPQTFSFILPNADPSNPVPSLVDNPLASYSFGYRLPDGFANTISYNTLSSSSSQEMSYHEEWKRTYRWPSSKVNPTEDYIKIKHLLAGNGKDKGSCEQLRIQVAKLFTYPAKAAPDRGSTIWKEFSNTTQPTQDEAKYPYFNLGSLEEAHNSVHLLIGGYGSMADPDYAGFDPIFYLHHANVDRILAFWEYVYNDYWMGDGYPNKQDVQVPFVQTGGTWATGDGATINQTSELMPFRRGEDDGYNYWTPNDTRFKSTVKKGYTYLPIGAVDINEAVPPDATTRKRYMGILRQHFNPTILSLYVPRESGSPEGPEAPLEHVRVGKYPTFTLIADAVGHAFNGSYYVQLSYGEWVIGSMAIFSRGEATQCSSCQGRARDGTRTRGVIDIPEVIVDQMVKDIRVGHKNVPMGDIVQHITTRITQKVVGPTGVLLAIASPKPPPESSAQDDPQSGSPLKKSIAPSVKLLSSFTAIPTSYAKDPTGAPLHYFGGCDHGTLETNEQGWTWA